MKKTKKNLNFISLHQKALKDSFKRIDLSFIWIIIADMLFYLASGYLIIFWLQRIQDKIQSFNLPSNIDAVSAQASQQLGDQIVQLNLTIRVSAVLLVVAVIFLAAIIKGFVWSRTSKTKFNFNFLSRFLVLNLIWMGILSALVYLVLFFIKSGLVFLFLIAILPLYSYLTYGVYGNFMKRQRFSESFSSIRISFRKIHYFIVPFIATVVLWLAALWLTALVRLDGVLFAAAARIYSLGGLDYSVFTISPLVPPVGMMVAIAVSVLANPLLRIITAFSRYYYDSLNSEVKKT
jgi:hypothetical protein